MKKMRKRENRKAKIKINPDFEEVLILDVEKNEP